MSAEMLKVSGLQMRFGGLLAVDGIDFDVRRDEVFAIIGPNGAGKTTVFNCVGGFYKPTGGEVTLDGRADRRPAEPPGGAARAGAYLSEYSPVQVADRGGEPARGAAPQVERPACCAGLFKPRRPTAAAEREALESGRRTGWNAWV